MYKTKYPVLMFYSAKKSLIYFARFWSQFLSKTSVTRLYLGLNFHIDKVDSKFIRSLEIRGKSEVT